MSEDIGRLTNDLRGSARDICEIWMRMPGRRCEYGDRELLDIRETVIGLQVLLREIDKANRPRLVSHI